MYQPKPYNVYLDKNYLLIKILKMLGGVTLFVALMAGVYAWTIMGAAMLGVL
tara:strand:- start:106 stop:261 length:156 start_codon:yes stop_codon:yes gene_type:complete